MDKKYYVIRNVGEEISEICVDLTDDEFIAFMKVANKLNDRRPEWGPNLVFYEADDRDLNDFGIKIEDELKFNTVWEYLDYLGFDKNHDAWEEAMRMAQKLHGQGKNPDDHLDKIIKHVNKMLK